MGLEEIFKFPEMIIIRDESFIVRGWSFDGRTEELTLRLTKASEKIQPDLDKVNYEKRYIYAGLYAIG